MFRCCLTLLSWVVLITSCAAHDFSVQWTAQTPGNPFYLDYTRDGMRVQGPCSDGMWRAWHSQTGARLAEWQPPTETTMYRFATSPDEALLAGGDLNGGLFLLDSTVSQFCRLEPSPGQIRRILFSEDGGLLVIASVDGVVRLISPAGDEVAQIGPIAGGLQDACLSPDGKTLATTGPDGNLRFWTVPDGRLESEHPLGRGTIRGLDYTPDGKLLAVGGDNAEVLLWSVREKRVIGSQPVDGFPYLVSFSPNGKTLAVGCHKYSPAHAGSVHVWETDGANPIESLGDLTTGIDGLSWHPNGMWLAASDTSQQVRVWRRAAAEPVPLTEAPPAESSQLWRDGLLSQRPAEPIVPLVIRDTRPDEFPDEYAAIEISGRSLQPLLAANLPPHLREARVYRLASPTGHETDGLTEFKVTRRGRLFLAATWNIIKSQSAEVRAELVKEADLIQAGWYPAGTFPERENHKLFMRYCREGETFRIRTTDRAPPLPIVAAPLDLTDPEVLHEIHDSPEFLFAAQITEWREQADIAKLEEVAERLRDTRAKFRTGRSQLELFYDIVGHGGLFDLDPPWAARLDFFADWMQQRPQSTTPRLCAADLLIAYAWQARGEGLANTLSERDRALFQERLTLAHEHALAAAELADDQPAVFMMLIHSAHGLTRNVAASRQHALRALRLDPAYIEVVQFMGTALLPRWYGRPGDLHDFGTDAVNTTRSSQGNAMYAVLAETVIQYELPEFTYQELKWNQIKQGYKDLIERHPEARGRRAEYIIHACRAGDRDAAEAAFAEYGGSYEESGFDGEHYYDAYRNGLRPGVRDGDHSLLISIPLGSVREVAFSADDRRLALKNGVNTLSVWNTKTGRAIVEPYSVTGHLTCLAFAGESNDFLVAGTSAGDVFVRDIRDLETADVVVVGKHRKSVIGLEYSVPSNWLFTASGDGTIKVWDGESAQFVREWSASHGTQLDAMALSADGQRLATSGADGMISIWDPSTGSAVRSWPIGAGTGKCVAISDDGRFVAGGNNASRVAVWDAATGELKAEADLNGARPRSLAFSPSGRVLALGCWEPGEWGAGGAWIWKFASGSPERLKGHDSEVSTVAFQKSESILATGSDDWTARLWTIKE